MPLVLIFAALSALPPVFPPADAQRGQHGECLTVFEGDTIEPFPFEVKGLMKNYLGPGRDLVLIKLLGEKATFSGVVAGMSGSPCTIDGKLVGALSYSFATFAKEPIAGVTPIDSMLELFRLPEETKPWRIAQSGSQKDDTWSAMREGRAPTALASAVKVSEGPTPIATPLMMGGFPPAVLAQFEPWLRSAGFEPVAAGHSGGHDPKVEGVPLVPGGSVAAMLIGGDMDVSATGTVTYVDGPKVLAFGHPFFGAGAVSIPMANSIILNTMASTMRSFKMAGTGPIVGEFTQDRLSAIGGTMGAHAALVPVHGSVETPHSKTTFDLQVARDLTMTPRMVAMGLSGSLAGRVDAAERGTVRVDAVIKVEGLEPVPVHAVYASPREASLMSMPAIDVARAFAALWESPFGPPPKMSVDVVAKVEPEPVVEAVEAVYLDRSRVHPGDKLDVAVRVRRLNGPTSVERFEITVPRSWAGHSVEVVATGVEGAEKIDQDVNGAPQPTDYKQIGRYLSRRRADGNIYLMAVRDGAGLHAAVDDFSFLPPSAVTLLSGDPTKHSRTRGLAWEERRARPGVVAGGAHAAVQVLGY